jgi:hypothetical protein
MKNLATTLAVALSVASGDFVSARLMKDWTWEELFSKSDFVVIAEPISDTHDTDERTNLEGIAPPLPVIGVATDFKTIFVLKGQKLDRFVLHHYRLPKSDVAPINGPALVAFNPKPLDWPAYLLFLVRERDGRFAPVDGQTDPRLFSVKQLSETGY